MRTAVIPTAGMYRMVQRLWPVFPRCPLQTMNIRLCCQPVRMIHCWSICCTPRRLCCRSVPCLRWHHTSCYKRACDGGSTSLCGSWLKRCRSQASVQHHRHHDLMVSHPACSCSSLPSVAECTMHTSCMFSYRTLLTGIFPVVFLHASPPFPFSGFVSHLSICVCVTEDGMQI